MRINSDEKRNFGWTIKTHANLSKLALEKFPQLTKYANNIIAGSQYPSVAMHNYYFINPRGHYFYGKEDVFLNKNCSALSNYLDYCTRACFKLKFKDTDSVAAQSGIALHFLQDIANPIHTQNKNKGIINYFRHYLFEKKAEKFSNNLSDFIVENDVKNTIPSAVFDDTYKKSSSMNHPFDKENMNNWDDTIKESLQLAYDSTCKFLEEVTQLLKTVK